MPATEAQIKANQANAKLSTGPKTVEGKEKSRQNALKHGLTGLGVVMVAADAAEVHRRAVEFDKELEPTGEIGIALVRRAALSSVRMERSADQQNAALAEHLRQVEADFIAPEGVSDAEATKLLTDVLRGAMFNPSKEAALARKYELAAERSFLRCLKELRQVERQCAPPIPTDFGPYSPGKSGSFSPDSISDEEFDEMCARMGVPLPPERRNPPKTTPSRVEIDVPITIGRSR